MLTLLLDWRLTLADSELTQTHRTFLSAVAIHNLGYIELRFIQYFHLYLLLITVFKIIDELCFIIESGRVHLSILVETGFFFLYKMLFIILCCYWLFLLTFVIRDRELNSLGRVVSDLKLRVFHPHFIETRKKIICMAIYNKYLIYNFFR